LQANPTPLLNDVLVSAAVANTSATQPPLPQPACGGEWEENRQKLVGRDKGSLTEQQTEETGTTTIQIRRKTRHEPHNPESHPPQPAPRAPEPQVSSRQAAPLPHRNPA